MKRIGRIIKTTGFEGAVVVRGESGITGEPKQGEPVFVIKDGIPVPFFVRDAFIQSTDTMIISFDGYPTGKSVEHLRGCEVAVEGEDKDTDDLMALTGFTLTDKNSTLKGTIAKVIQNPGQILAMVKTSGGEILVPLHPDLIISLDKKRKEIVMSLPEGLSQLNN